MALYLGNQFISGIPLNYEDPEVMAAIEAALPKTGGDITGPLNVQEPTEDSNAATKKYVDEMCANNTGVYAQPDEPADAEVGSLWIDTDENPELVPKVDSFNGRTGAVVPHAGDYTAEMVGAADRTLSNLSNMQRGLYNIGGRPRKNLVINPRFKVNQRGQSSYSGAGRCVDMWKLIGNASATVTSNGISINGSTTSDYFTTVFPADSISAGVPVTISILLDGQLKTATFTMSTSGQFAVMGLGADGNNPLILYAYNEAAQSVITLSIRFFEPVTAEISGVKVEIGEGQTLAYQDSNGAWQLFDDYDYNADLLECQRYFRDLSFVPVTLATTKQSNIGYFSSGLVINPPMVAKPDVSILQKNGNVAQVEGVEYFQTGLTGFTPTGENTNTILFALDTTYSVGGCVMYVNRVQLSAEL